MPRPNVLFKLEKQIQLLKTLHKDKDTPVAEIARLINILIM